MSMDKSKPVTDKNKPAKPAAPTPPPAPSTPEVIPTHTPPLFRRTDWLTFLITTLVVWFGYYWTLAPDLTLEDSGELAVASLYGGIPHPPGYPVWTIYTYFWANWLPFGNIAWRVALGEATAGAIACGLLGLLISRGSSMLMEGIAQIKEIAGKWENAICVVSGFVGGLLLGFNGYMWSQSVIVEVYSFSVLSLVAVLLFLLRWVYAPHQNRYLLLAFFMYGICVNNHQSLLPIAMGLEVLIIAVRPRLGREFLFWNVVVYLLALFLGPSLLIGNKMVFIIFNLVGISSIAGWTWLRLKEKSSASAWVGCGTVVLTAGLYLLMKLNIKDPTSDYEATKAAEALKSIRWWPFAGMIGFFLVHGYTSLRGLFDKAARSWDALITLGTGLAFAAGMAFYLYMPIAGASNPPMQWGYPRTLEGFIHAFTRGQYEKIRPTDGTGEGLEWFVSLISTYSKQLLMYLDGMDNEFNLVCILIAISVFLFYRSMQKRERSWIAGVVGIFMCLGPLLVLLLNPPPDRQARELIRVFFTASHVLVSIGVGYGMALVAASLATHYQAFRKFAIAMGIVAVDLAIYALGVDTYSSLTDPAVAGANAFMNCLVKLVFIGLTAACFALAAFQLVRAAESDEDSMKPVLTLTGIGTGCLLTCLALFRSTQLNPAQAAFKGFDKLIAILAGGADIGTDSPAMIAIAKVVIILIAAVCIFLSNRPKQVNDRQIFRIVAGGFMALSFLLTLIIIMGEKFSFGGIGDFFSTLAKAFEPGQFALPVHASLLLVGLTIVFLAGVVLWKNRAPLALTLAVFAVMPLQSYMSHWDANEQRGHMFGHWFGHDMFTPPFTGKDGKPLYPEMTRDAILYGGTDPGRFCPTYTIFCDSFTDPEDKADPKYDRRDVYIITQNALADGTYLNYIRAHYHRSAQKARKLDTPFFQEALRSAAEREANQKTNLFARAGAVLDRWVLKTGEAIEKNRRAGSSFFTEADFLDVNAFAAKLRTPTNDFAKQLAGELSADTRALLSSGDAGALKRALSKDLNQVLEKGLYDDRALTNNVAAEWAELLNTYEAIAAEKQRLTQLRASPLAMQRLLAEEAASKQRLANLQAERQKLADAVEARFNASGVPITSRLKDFILEAPSSYTRIRLQRQLIEAGFPNEIAVSKGGVYPDQEMYIASPLDSQDCFTEYLQDAQARLQRGQLKPGEDVKIIGGKVQVSGQVAVMAINGLLTKVMFDRNPHNEFFVEESFPLDWMYPHLTPFGVIMKINRQPLPTFTEDIFARDHEFWSQYSDRLIGNWIKYETTVDEIVAFVEKVYLRHNWSGLNEGQRKFARDDNAQKAFSKLRSSIGGVYSWRLGYSCPPEYRPKSEAEMRRFYQEADFTFKQAFAFCPYSPEALFRYVQLLVQPPAPIKPRVEDALKLARTALKLDPYNSSIAGLIANLEEVKKRMGDTTAMQKLEDELKANPDNLSSMLSLAFLNLQAQQFDRGFALLDTLVSHPRVSVSLLAPVIDAYKQLNNMPRMETALVRLTQLAPQNPEAWYDLATVRIAQSKPAEAFAAISNAITLSNARRANDPKANDLAATARSDGNLASLQAMPEFQKLFTR
jgi:thioredoxin-like negative regulator of GroEL